MIDIKHSFNNIDHNHELMLALLKAVIMEDFVYPEQFVNKDTDWNAIYKLAISSKVDGLVYYACSKNPLLKEKLMEHVQAEQWKELTRIHHISQSYKHAAVKQIINAAEKDKLQLVFFKGMVLADLYPRFDLRYSGDTDIYVQDKDKEKVIDLLYSLGYEKNEEHSKANVPVFVSSKMNHIIELHYSLWEDYEGKRIKILNEMQLTDPQSLIEIEACKLKLTTLGHEQHFIYQMFHIIKHFITDAVNIRYLVDITLFVNRYENHINYKVFWERMEKLGYTTFCVNFLNICAKYLNMSPTILAEITYVEDEEIEEALLLDLIHKGLLYENKTSPWQILGIMTPYLVGEEHVPVSSFKRKINVLFPKASMLPEKFSYAKKNKILLPFAWIHKIFDFVRRYYTFNKLYKDWYNPVEKLEVAEYRLQLLKKLEL